MDILKIGFQSRNTNEIYRFSHLRKNSWKHTRCGKPFWRDIAVS